MTTDKPKRNPINRTLEFLKPTPLKLVFLVEWLLYLLFEAVMGSLPTLDQIITILYPLVLYYLIACLLVHLSQGYSGSPRVSALLGMALILVVVEQAAKLAVSVWLPMGESLSIIPGQIYLSQSHNLYNSWLFRRFGWDIAQGFWLPLFSLLFSILLIQGYRYYAFTTGRSFWTDLALVALLGGVLGALVDQVGRGFTLDFIALADHFVADLKDVYLSFGIGAILAETVVRPAPKREARKGDSAKMVKGFLDFTWQDIKILLERNSQRQPPNG